MANVLIVFDRISLAISKNDFDCIAGTNKKVKGITYTFDEDAGALLIIEGEKPLMACFFSKVMLDGKECYEISKIKHRLDKEPNLPDDYKQVNNECHLVMKEIFTLLNNIVADNIKPNEIMHRYYLRNRGKGTYDIVVGFEERFSYVSFKDKLGWAFGIESCGE